MSDSPFLVLHVCTGNICRSPMAELLMRAELDRSYGDAAARVALDGGGTYGGHAGDPINPPAGTVLWARGVDPSHFRAQGLSGAAVAAAGLVLVAAREHAHRVVTLEPSAAGRTYPLLDLADLAMRRADVLPDTRDPAERLRALRDLAQEQIRPPSTVSDIPDPYGLSMDVFEATARQIHVAVRQIVGAPSRETPAVRS